MESTIQSNLCKPRTQKPTWDVKEQLGVMRMLRTETAQRRTQTRGRVVSVTSSEDAIQHVDPPLAGKSSKHRTINTSARSPQKKKG